MASVDVVVPCYNYAKYLPRCIDSILTQEDVQVRVLIIDDCSTDDSPQVGAALAAREPRVEYRRHATNMRHIATYNEGLFEWASAEYALLISADDALVQGCLSRATRLLDAHPEASFAFGTALTFYEDEYPTVNPVGHDFQSEIVHPERFLEHCFKVGNPVPTASAVVRTVVQHRVGPYDAGLPHSADMHMWMRFAAEGPIVAIRPIQALYRRHVTSMSRAYYAQANSDRREVMMTCQWLLDKLSAPYPRVIELNEQLRRRLASDSLWTANAALDEGALEEFDDCVRFALEADPAIRRTNAWWRIKAKRLLGRRLSRAIRRIRGSSAAPASTESPMHFKTPREIGWWS